MIDNTNQQIRRWSIISGISLLIMTVAAGYAYGYVFSQVYEAGNVTTTLNNIQTNYVLYVTGIVAWGIILVLDLLISYGFYLYLKPIHNKLALTSGLLRLFYSFILGIAIVFLIRNDIELFNRIWSLGLFIFGFHLTVTGIVVIRKTGLLRILGILLIIAGISYSIVEGLYNFLPGLDSFTASLESILVIPMTIGELFFGIWLLVKGGKTPNQQPLSDYVQVGE